MIKTIPLGHSGTNCYVYTNNATGKSVIIDPAGDAPRLLDEVRGMDIAAIILTHGHFDHIGASDQVRHALNVPVFASKNDAALANNQDHNGTAFFSMRPISAAVDHFLTEGENDFGGVALDVIFTPGHTYGSVCLYSPADKVLIAGDTLFKESYGRYDLPTGDYGALRASVTALFELPEDVAVYPGHGPATTIGHEKANNPILR